MLASSVYKRFLEFMHHSGFDPMQMKFLVAVSGGMDSMILLHLFHRSPFNFSAVHCNFGLRGAESDADEQFVKAFCEKNNIPCYTRRFDLSLPGEANESIQIRARRVRYEWFKELMHEHQYDWVCTAHHQRDNAETLIQHFVQGNYPESMQGIKPNSFFRLRPLLYTPYKELLSFAHEHPIDFRTDASNLTDHYLRNKIRQHVLPVMEEVFGESVQQNLEEAALRYTHYAAYLHEKARALIEPAQGYEEISVDVLRATAGASALLYEAIKDYGFNFEQCHHVCQNLERPKGTYFENKDRSFQLIYAGDVLQLHHRVAMLTKEVPVPDEEVLELECNRMHFRLYTVARASVNLRKLHAGYAYLDYEKCKGHVMQLGPWHASDTFVPLGMKGKKKLSDFLTNLKISPAQKYRTQVLRVGGEIAWIAGHRIHDAFKITDATTRVLVVETVDGTPKQSGGRW